MYRILSASKDSYITNKYVGGERCETSNVGQAGTLDLYKLYDETTIVGVTSSIVEMSRLLVKVDYSSLSTFDYSNPSFSCFLHLKDVYGGQTTPSNFTIEMFPLSKSFDEGRGSDVVGLRDVDTCNWLSASATTPWVSPGAGATGSLGGTLDALTDVGLFKQTFERGDEDPVERDEDDERPEQEERVGEDAGDGGLLLDRGGHEEAGEEGAVVRRGIGGHASNLLVWRTAKLKKETQTMVETKSSR